MEKSILSDITDNEEVSVNKKHILITELGNEMIAFNALDVIEILEFVKVSSVPMSPSFIKGITQLRGDIVTVVNLEKILNFELNSITEDARIVITKSGDMLLGIMVDKAHEMCKVDPDVFGKSSCFAGASSDMYSGAFKMDDHVINILELDKLCVFLNNFGYA